MDNAVVLEVEMRVVALLAVYNEERFIATCLEHLFRQYVEVYLCDNESSDQTVAIAEGYRGRGLIGIETLPRAGVYSWRPILERKEHLATKLDSDWFIHLDADEIRLPPRSNTNLAEVFERVEWQGYNAVNFLEFTFLPTQESPYHDHLKFQETMQWYYPFLPSFPHRLNAWKAQASPVELAWSGGHQVRFPGMRMYPYSFPMRHYLCLSVEHAREEYVSRRYDFREVASGWHGWRADLQRDMIKFPAQSELRTYTNDDELDWRNPRTKHYFEKGELDQK